MESLRPARLGYKFPGACFIIIRTMRCYHFFGKIMNGEMDLSPCGVFADVCCENIPDHFQGLESGEFAVMAKHSHGILVFSISGTLSMVSLQKSIDEMSL